MSHPAPRATALVDHIAALTQERSLTLGVAESLTGGQIAAALAAGPDAADWLRGSVVAYSPEVKYEVLGVRPGPVNTAVCASQMAIGSTSVLGCGVAVSATGVGGPGSSEGVPAGVVFIATAAGDEDVRVNEHRLSGDPGDVVEQTVVLALEAIVTALLGPTPAVRGSSGGLKTSGPSVPAGWRRPTSWRQT